VVSSWDRAGEESTGGDAVCLFALCFGNDADDVDCWLRFGGVCVEYVYADADVRHYDVSDIIGGDVGQFGFPCGDTEHAGRSVLRTGGEETEKRSDASVGYRKHRYSGITSLQIDLDNGPELESGRTQFIKRMVDWSDKIQLPIELVYYPPPSQQAQHSKYNPVEHCWGITSIVWSETTIVELH